MEGVRLPTNHGFDELSGNLSLTVPEEEQMLYREYARKALDQEPAAQALSVHAAIDRSCLRPRVRSASSC
jgi:hypothetical protein